MNIFHFSHPEQVILGLPNVNLEQKKQILSTCCRTLVDFALSILEPAICPIFASRVLECFEDLIAFRGARYKEQLKRGAGKKEGRKEWLEHFCN